MFPAPPFSAIQCSSSCVRWMLYLFHIEDDRVSLLCRFRQNYFRSSRGRAFSACCPTVCYRFFSSTPPVASPPSPNLLETGAFSSSLNSGPWFWGGFFAPFFFSEYFHLCFALPMPEPTVACPSPSIDITMALVRAFGMCTFRVSLFTSLYCGFFSFLRPLSASAFDSSSFWPRLLCRHPALCKCHFPSTAFPCNFFLWSPFVDACTPFSNPRFFF